MLHASSHNASKPLITTKCDAAFPGLPTLGLIYAYVILGIRALPLAKTRPLEESAARAGVPVEHDQMRGCRGSACDDFLSTRNPRTITKLRGLTPRKLESRTSRRPRRAGGF